jgi:hypothetical protein
MKDKVAAQVTVKSARRRAADVRFTPTADIETNCWDVRIVPKADIRPKH